MKNHVWFNSSLLFESILSIAVYVDWMLKRILFEKSCCGELFADLSRWDNRITLTPKKVLRHRVSPDKKCSPSDVRLCVCDFCGPYGFNLQLHWMCIALRLSISLFLLVLSLSHRQKRGKKRLSPKLHECMDFVRIRTLLTINSRYALWL